MMKRIVPILKVLLVAVALVGLYAFAGARNSKRLLYGEPKIEFINDEGMFITRHTVNKLLIQKGGAQVGEPKEKLDLNNAETALNAHEMVRKAEVYVTVDGRIGAKILQRTPIGRLGGGRSSYIDEEGELMPLSPVFSARVPLVTGVSSASEREEVYPLLKFIDQDNFLKKHIIGIHRNTDGFELRLRKEQFILRLGSAEDMGLKFRNFKAFYQKALKDGSLTAYTSVNLKFNNQVVCTKK